MPEDESMQNKRSLTDGLHVHFDPTFETGVAPRLGDDDAVAGVSWVGVLGLLSLLETRLGLSQPTVRPLARAMALEPRIADTAGFWSDSAQCDALAVSQILLRWRDELVMEGWIGQCEGQERLEQLWAVTGDIPSGHADRLLKVLAEVKDRGAPDLARITLYRKRALLPSLCQQVLVALEDKDVQVDDSDKADASLTDNVRLLRTARPRMAAQEVAAWLASEERWRETVIIGADEILDAELKAFGLPVTGAAPANGSLGILRGLLLYLQAFTDKVLDPDAVQQLLLLKKNPVPYGLRWRLTRALHEWPAVWSAKWVEAVDEFSEKEGQSESEKKALISSLRGMFPSPDDLESKPLGCLVSAVLDSEYLPWVNGLLHGADDDGGLWAQASSLFGALRDELDHAADTLTAARLHRLLEEFASELTAMAHTPREAGLECVQDPGAITASSNYVIWWNFTAASADVPGSTALTPVEQAYLETENIDVQLTTRLKRHSCHWENPLRLASKQCILVCPLEDVRGEALGPHPLWSRIAPGNSGLELSSLRSLYDYQSSPRLLRELPAGRETWEVKEETPFVRETDSRSSMEAMVRCPAKWYYHYACGLGTGGTAPLNSGPLLQGNLFHEIAHRVLEELPATPKDAVAKALEILDNDGPLLAAHYFRKQSAADRAQVRARFKNAFKALFDRVHEAGLGSTEKEILRKFGPWTLKGRLDLTLKDPPGVVDFKTGGAEKRRAELVKGYAVQLAMYSWLVDENNPPPAHYLIVNNAEWLSSEELTKDVSLEQTWQAFSETYRDALANVHAGVLEARGACMQGEKPAKDQLETETNRIILKPECEYCDYAALCGQLFGEVA